MADDDDADTKTYESQTNNNTQQLQDINNNLKTNVVIGTANYRFEPYKMVEHRRDKTIIFYCQHVCIENGVLENKSQEELQYEDQYVCTNNANIVHHEKKQGTLDSDESDHDSDDKSDEKEKQNIDHEARKIQIDGCLMIFNTSDLKSMKYFANYLSNRWKINDTINIPISESKQFGVQELDMIICCKKNENTSIVYPFERLPFLMNALDYFTELISSELLYKYMMAYVPVIRLNDINKITKFVPNPMDKTWCELNTAVTKYKHTKQQMIQQMYNKFVEQWETLPINIIAKMKNVSYQILMNTLILHKLGENPSIMCAPWDRDCIITLKFLTKRSVDDFFALWNIIAKNRNYRYLLNILSTMTSAYLSRKNLRWDNISNAGHHYRNEYKKFIEQPKIKPVIEWLIINTFSMLLTDKSKHYEIYNELTDIIQMYKESYYYTQETEISTFYSKMVDIYFKYKNVFHPSMLILFGDKYYNEITLQNKFESFTQEVKRFFLYDFFH
eukprot:47343_1